MNISILSCGNVKDECGCAGKGCMRAFNWRLAAFDGYGDEKITLVAYNFCAGCPTICAYEKILKRVKPLVEFAKADRIHFSSCMAARSFRSKV